MSLGHTLTTLQTSRVDRLVLQWNALRGDLRRTATRDELVDYLLQREEDELSAMADSRDAEVPGSADEPIPFVLNNSASFELAACEAAQ